MTEAQINKVAQEAARAAVKETLLTIGIDTNNPLEFQRDMQHLRAWREASATVKRQGLITAVGILTAGFLAIIWLYIKG